MSDKCMKHNLLLWEKTQIYGGMRSRHVTLKQTK